MTIPIPFRNMRDVLGLHAKVSPHKPALIAYDATHTRHEISYLELVGKAHQIANVLFDDLGIARGDRIAVMSTNHPHAVILYFAIWVIGATVVSVASDTATDELVTTLEASEARLFIASDVLLAQHAPHIPALPMLEGVIQIGGRSDAYLRLEDLASNRPTTFLGDESGAKGTDVPLREGNVRTARLSDPALINYQYGNPITRTQGMLLRDSLILAQHTAFSGNQTALAWLPLHQRFAVSILAPLSVGGTVIFTEQANTDDLWRLLVQERAHVSTLDRRTLTALIERAQDHMADGGTRFGHRIIQQDIKHVRHLLLIDESLNTSQLREFETLFGIPVLTGSTHPTDERLLTLLPITLSWSAHQTWLCDQRIPSVGVALEPLRVLLADGTEAPPDQVGQLASRVNGKWERMLVPASYRLNSAGDAYFFSW
ncbi:MAG: AMP-binding protein [Anaerolineae bacterium]